MSGRRREAVSRHKLLPCPFCTSTNIFLGKTRRWWVSCDGCGCDGPHSGSAKGAANAWNDRQAYDLRDDASEYEAGEA